MLRCFLLAQDPPPARTIFAMLKRTHKCGELRAEHVGKTITLNGWVDSYRHHGRLIFIDVRDHTGVTQLVFDPDQGQEMHELAATYRREDVIAAQGKVVKRQSVNEKIPTGEIEIVASKTERLNKCAKPPILPDEARDDTGTVSEDMRLRYRYIDLRRPRMQRIIRTRHRVTQIIRNTMTEMGFCEIETPVLCKSTPEGARDFLVPCRLMPRTFYALPQSPQILKQILMMAGFDRYFQIVKCFRDENLRFDRQPEFTQLDVEMAFVEQDDVFAAFEQVIRAVWKQLLGVEIGAIPRLTYEEVMNTYGSDKPDLRYGVKLYDVTEIARRCDFRVFTSAIEGGGVVKAIAVPGAATFSRKQTDALGEWVKQFGAGGLPTTKVIAGGRLEGGIAKFVEGVAPELIATLGAGEGDLICFAADKLDVANRVLGELRRKLAGELKLAREGQWAMFWVVDFPLFLWNEEDQRWDSAHHPFCAPRPEQLHLLDTDPHQITAQTYDFVINGHEMVSGSIRIHQPEVQQKIFQLLNISDEEAKDRFGFLIEAMSYGCPPLGGFALGLDRLVMLLCGTDNIRDVIAFPKTQTGADLMMQAPSAVDAKQLEELNIMLKPEAK